MKDCPECKAPLERLDEETIVCSDCAYIEEKKADENPTPKPDAGSGKKVAKKRGGNKKASKGSKPKTKAAGKSKKAKQETAQDRFINHMKNKEAEKPIGAERPATPEEPVTASLRTATRLDKVSPGLKKLSVVTVYAWPIGVRGYRYGTAPPKYLSPAWKLDMTGVDAVSFLNKIAKQHRYGRLESKSLPEKKVQA